MLGCVVVPFLFAIVAFGVLLLFFLLLCSRGIAKLRCLGLLSLSFAFSQQRSISAYSTFGPKLIVALDLHELGKNLFLGRGLSWAWAYETLVVGIKCRRELEEQLGSNALCSHAASKGYEVIPNLPHLASQVGSWTGYFASLKKVYERCNKFQIWCGLLYCF